VNYGGKAVNYRISPMVFLYFYKMSTAGYSETPLLKKLGIKAGYKLLLINAPDNYSGLLETDIRTQICKASELPDLIHLFAKNYKEFETGMKKIKSTIQANQNIVIWVSWYKKSSRVATDLTEDVIRNFALKNNLVDVKVCAVSDTWSGLKLVVPLSKRI
jgi:hypothetical protein